MPPVKDDAKVKLEPEKTIAERVKLNIRKKTITRAGLKIFTPKKTINQTFNIIGTKKSWKQFMQIKK